MRSSLVLCRQHLNKAHCRAVILDSLTTRHYSRVRSVWKSASKRRGTARLNVWSDGKGKAKTQSARLPESFKYNPKGEQGERTDGGSWSSRGRGPKFGNRHERNQDREGKKNGYKGAVPPQDSRERGMSRESINPGNRERRRPPYAGNVQEQSNSQNAERPNRSGLQGSPDFAERTSMADRFNGAASSGPTRSNPLPSRNGLDRFQREASVDRSWQQSNEGFSANRGASEVWQQRNNNGAEQSRGGSRSHRSGQGDGQGRGNGRRGSEYRDFPLSRQVDPRQAIRYPSSVSSAPPPYYQPKEADPVLKAIREDWQGEALYGVNSISAAFAAERREIHALYFQEGAEAGKQGPQIRQVQRQAEAAGIPCKSLSKHDLNVLTDNAAHQGVVLDCSPLQFETMDDLGPAPKATCPLWVALDEVTDPHNMGAIVRSVTVMGATGVLTCARNSSPLSPAVSKVSAGTIEHFPLFSCHALQKTLTKASKAGWRVLGATVSPAAIPCHTLRLDQPTVIVLGSEGKGLRTNVQMACSDLVRIGANTALPEGIDSLNVSVAAGILVHHFLTSMRL